MALARKIQTVLLPEEPALEGYEIAAHMSPATEVGGDYYDVIDVGGTGWLVIGDVSGHGVSAGLVMMMVQTAIQVTLRASPRLSPSQVLDRVNRALKENIQRLGEARYMTITILAVQRDGRFVFSGMHQDIFVYRAASGQVETVPTTGAWLGLVDDLGAVLQDTAVQLNVGDVMLLYTDGITEAWRKGATSGARDSRDMFGEDRLREIFGEAAGSSAANVKDRILDALLGYDCDDDVTLLAIRRQA
jgi:serine phosphatase RsbU (regulator of sigma subunit)